MDEVMSPSESARLYAHPWHAPQHPQRVQDAWDSFQAALEVAEDATSEVHKLEQERRGYKRAKILAMRAELRGETPPKVPARKDWGKLIDDASAKARAAVENALQLRASYDRMENDRDIAREYRNTLRPIYFEARKRAAEAVRQASDQFHYMMKLQSEIARAGQTAGVLDRAKFPIMKNLADEVDFSAALRFFGTAGQLRSMTYVAGSDEELTMDPPYAVREWWAMARRGERDYARLKAVELAERERGEIVTTFIIDEHGNERLDHHAYLDGVLSR